MLNQKLLMWFYLLSPFFLLIDIIFGWDLRVSFLDQHTGWKVTYYVFCFGIGVLMWRWNELEPILGLIEGGINLLLLTLSIFIPYYQMIDALSSGSQVDNPLDVATIINYLLTGTFLLITMQLRRHQHPQ